MCFSSSWSRPKKPPTVRVKPQTADIPISLLKNTHPTYVLSPSYQQYNLPTTFSYDSQMRDRELQKERERQHESVMGEVQFVQTLKEKLAPPPPPPPHNATKEKDHPKPSETEKRMIEGMGKLVSLVDKREREDEIERAVRRGREEGVREGRELAGLGLGMIGGGGGGGGAVMGAGWAAHFAAYPRREEYDAYIPQPRRRSSASETARNVARRVMERVDWVGDRLGRDIERVGERVRGVEREMGEFERELNSRELQRERERAVERQMDRYSQFGRRWT